MTVARSCTSRGWCAKVAPAWPLGPSMRPPYSRSLCTLPLTHPTLPLGLQVREHRVRMTMAWSIKLLIDYHQLGQMSLVAW